MIIIKNNELIKCKRQSHLRRRTLRYGIPGAVDGAVDGLYVPAGSETESGVALVRRFTSVRDVGRCYSESIVDLRHWNSK